MGADRLAGGTRAAGPVSDESRPLPRDRAFAIAHAFLPPSASFGERWNYHYVRSKLASDPLYPGVLQALRGSRAPLLDLGCGLGLLAHALRADGQDMPYLGVDNDTLKIHRARHASAAAQLPSVEFEIGDLARALPRHGGSVAILDVLQYLQAPAQQRLLDAAIAMLVPGARLVIRAALVDGSRRGRISRLSDHAANLIGWMQSAPRCYPQAAHLRAGLEGAGLQVAFSPLYGRTPFNNWLVVAERTGS
jgi:SAM-dependent methyltransferase